MDSVDDKPNAKKRRKTGHRCVVFGCSNTFYEGFILHHLPGKMPVGQERFDSIQRQWISFIGRKRKFEVSDARTYAHIYVCSGHFVHDDYDSTQVEMFRRRLRMRPPSLKRGAVPSCDTAEQPFPPDWFLPSTSSTPTSTSSTPTSTSSTLTSSITHAVAGTTTTNSCTLSSAVPCFASTSTSSSGPLQKRSRKESIYIRKREVAALCTDYDRKAKEERAQDILDRSKGHQWVVATADHKVGTHLRKRTCKVQIRPVSKSKGTQAHLIEKQIPSRPVILLADAGTQTTESSLKKVSDEDMVTEEEPPDFEIEYDSDNTTKDPTYHPGRSRQNRSSSDEETYKVTQPADIWDENKYIVFEGNMLALFKQCFSCRSEDVDIEKIRPNSFGSQLKVRATCKECKKIKEWHSQPKVGNVVAGNLLLSAAILYGGASPAKVLRVLNHMNLKVISNNTFLEYQNTYLQPAIIRVYQMEQRSLVRRLQGAEVVIGGDGRADSPGHCAKYGSYAMMDMKTKKIIDLQLVQSNEVTSSNAMEKEGLERGLLKLTELGVKVAGLITDRHASVAKWMRENYPDIDHRYDVWHIAKGVQKKITAISKLKDCEAAGKWKKSMVNHIYWSAATTPDGNGEMMVAKYKSVFNHLKNVHEHEGPYPSCGHGEDYPEREWMKEGTKVYEKLAEELLKTCLLNDMKRMSPREQTSSVESFHSVLLYYCPKMLAYSYAGMKCRLYLAALHWNENADRAQATKADGTPMYRVTFQKAKLGRHTVSRVLVACTFEYVRALMMETLRLVASKQKLRPEMPELQSKPPLSSKYQRPDREEAIQQAESHRRYANE